MGLTNTAATVPGIVAPAFTAYMTPNVSDWVPSNYLTVI